MKLEGGGGGRRHVARIVAAGIPVMGHVGLTPQSVHAMGGFKVQGKSDEAAGRVLRDAKALEEAGRYAIVLEGIPPISAAASPKASRFRRSASARVRIATARCWCVTTFSGCTARFAPSSSNATPSSAMPWSKRPGTTCARCRKSRVPDPEHSFGMGKPGVGAPTGSKPLVEGTPPAYGQASDDPSA